MTQFHKAIVALALTGSLFAVTGTANAAPDERNDGRFQRSSASLGVAVGDPSAVDLKIWTGEGSGIDFGIGFRRFSERLGIYIEYELGLASFWLGDSAKGIFYIGLGGAVSLRHRRDDLGLALVIPIGLNIRFAAPVEIFLEARPGIEVLDQSGFGIGGQLGVRFVF